jgi:hypothetical protein
MSAQSPRPSPLTAISRERALGTLARPKHIPISRAERPGSWIELGTNAKGPLGHCSLQDPVDALPGNLETAGDLSGCQTLGDKPTQFFTVYRSLASFVDVIRFGFGDAFHLPFAPKVRFEFGEDYEHIKEALPRGGACVNWLCSKKPARPAESFTARG